VKSTQLIQPEKATLTHGAAVAGYTRRLDARPKLRSIPMHDQDMYSRTRAPAGGGAHEAGDGGSKAAIAADTAKETAKDEARTVAATAKQEAANVVGEARGQVRRLASQARDQATDRVRGSHGKMVERLRGLADEFEEMGRDGDSPGKALVSDLGQRGRRVADYLADRGPEGLLSEVTDFARRRPMAFIATAVAAGFLAGRLGKNIWKAQSEDAGASSQHYQPVAATPTTPQATTMGATPATTPQWTEPPATATGVAPVPSSAAPMAPAEPGMPMTEPIADPFAEPIAEPVPPTRYVPESYNDPYGATEPRGGEPR